MSERCRGRPPNQCQGFRNDSERRAADRERVRDYQSRQSIQKAHSFRACIFDDNFEEASVSELDIGRMNVRCSYCNALHFSLEAVDGHFNKCCHNGLLWLPEPRINADLEQLFLNNNGFMNNIRTYNSSMAFASFSATKKDIPGSGPYCFKIQGQIHRYISDLLPVDGKEPSYGQLYFIDTASAICTRRSVNVDKSIDDAIWTKLTDILSENPYALAYIKAAEVIKSEQMISDISLNFKDTFPMNMRTSNRPTAEEVAGLFRSKDGEPPGYRYVIAHYRQSGPKLLSILSPHCDPMLYPLLFPFGEPGWDDSMTHNGPRKQSKRNRVTICQFSCYRLAIRRDFSHIHQGKKLFQQYIVDLYVRMEENNLKWVWQNQEKLRVEQYKGLLDFVLNRASLNKISPGKIFVLPSTFEGSRRNMEQRFQDAMAIVRKEGAPDIFLTFTCNPNWVEITSSLRPHETAADRPDIVARVFNCKLNELKRDILKNHVLGVIVAHVYVIEFQKRGLPHCHLCLTLDGDSKLREAIDIDRLVCAEIPDPNLYPKLHKIVQTFMMHGPCGVENPNSPCMKEGVCTKKYPKEFNESTSKNVNGYPLYRRRKNGPLIHKGVHEMDNRSVVPYNPVLLLKYNAHVNVEVCCSFRSVKYLFKYIYKGYDTACIEYVDSNDNSCMKYDEINHYLNMRYVSPPEAMWRLHSNNMHQQSHNIIRLGVHEEDCQNVYFEEGTEEEVLKTSAVKDTTLTAWFKLNKIDVNARQCTYTEIPEHYRFISNKWKPRILKLRNIIGRMYGVSPKDTNRFHLRLLLQHVKGACSFDELLSYNGTIFQDYKQVVLARGLLQDNTEWYNCLKEMESTHMPKQLRDMFAYICCFNEPLSPQNLWTSFKTALSEDFRDVNRDVNENRALLEIDEILRSNGSSCQQIGLPAPIEEQNINNSIPDHTECKRHANVLFGKMNDEKKIVAKRILASIRGENDETLFFLEAGGGCGKTYLYEYLLNEVRGNGDIALAAAYTGIAALLLPGGKTLHSLFGLPVPLTNTSTSNIKPNSAKAAILRVAKLIVIDEASMTPAMVVNCMDQLLREIMKSVNSSLQYVPFGGKVMVFGGDFRQVLPVIPHGNKVQIIESCMQNCDLWINFTKLHLTENMRTGPEENDFAEWLIALGNGQLNYKKEENLDTVNLSQNIICDEKSLIKHVFGEKLTEHTMINYLSRAIVTPLNENCAKLNMTIIQLLSGESKDYVSTDSVVANDPSEKLDIPLEFINSLTPSGMPPHILTLKVGAIVMLIRNMNLASGLVNGVRLIVREMNFSSLKLEIITGKGKGKIILLPRIKLISSDPNMPFAMTRIQFPIRLSFAMTINKSQGQTFEKIGIYLPKPVFSHGQLYVALSRVKSSSSIKIYLEPTETQGEENGIAYTKNVIYTEVLLLQQ